MILNRTYEPCIPTLCEKSTYDTSSYNVVSMASHNETGTKGEDMAVNYLVAHGYDIVERNWRLNHLELDIVARKGTRIVFVEVKTRTSTFIDPREAITPRKMRNMVNSANGYMQQYSLNFEAQFDLILITPGNEGEAHLEHIADAFYPPMKTYC